MPHGEPLLADILADHAQQALTGRRGKVVLTDHGSPIPTVTEVRQRLAMMTQAKLGEEIVLDQAVMERREGQEYDFNGDLLETYLKHQAEEGITQIVVLMMFFLPGRHAGPDGDVVDICQGVMDQYPQLSVHISPLVSEHPKLIDILEQRLRSV